MSKRLENERELLTCPGDTLAETLQGRNMTPLELAEQMRVELRLVLGIIDGKEAVTYEIAGSLEKILGIDASFWLVSEARYRSKYRWIMEQERREAENKAQ